jgi:hypothetical protein
MGPPGADTLAVFIKFRTALFFDSPLDLGVNLKSFGFFGWLVWLLSVPYSKGLSVLTGDKAFDSAFFLSAKDGALAKFLFDQEIRGAILELSEFSLYGAGVEVELTDRYISVSEGPYMDRWSGLPRVGSGEASISKFSSVGYFDKSEEVLVKLVKLAKLLEDRLCMQREKS